MLAPQSQTILPWPVPGQEEKEGMLGMGLTNPPDQNFCDSKGKKLHMAADTKQEQHLSINDFLILRAGPAIFLKSQQHTVTNKQG